MSKHGFNLDETQEETIDYDEEQALKQAQKMYKQKGFKSLLLEGVSDLETLTEVFPEEPYTKPKPAVMNLRAF